MSEKRHYKDYFESSVLNNGDFDNDNDTIVKILSAQDMKIKTRDGDIVTLCAMLDGYKLPFRVNATVAKNIHKALKTPYPEEWAGKHITIYILKNLVAFGDSHDVPRVRPQAPRLKVMTPASPEQVANICEGFKKHGESIEAYCKKVGLNKIEDIKQDKAVTLINWLIKKGQA